MKPALLLIAALSFTAYSQDFVVTMRNDTLKGEVKPLYYDKMDRVQVVSDGKKTSLTAVQVRSYFYKGEVYKPMKLDNTIRFMKVKIDGYLSLYYFRPENQTRFDALYMSKRDGTGMEVPNLTFKKSVAAYLSDAANLSSRIREGELGRNDIDSIVKEYNAFIDQRTQSREKEVVKIEKGNVKFEALEKLRKAVESQPDFASKKDALDLINDVGPKVRAGQGVSDYLVNTLKGFLSSVDATKADLDNFLTILKEN